MNGRERTLRAIDFKPTDRVPVVGGFVRHPPFLAQAAGTTVEAFWDDPKGVAIRAFRNLGVDCIIGLILPSANSATGAQVGMHKPSRFDSPEAMLEEIGVKVLWHADGNIAPIAPHLLDAGADGFQGLQETIETRIDVAALRELRTREGKPPVIVGSVSSVTTMPFGTPDDVRSDVRRCRALAAAKGGGWLLNFSSSLGPECPMENIQTYFEEATCE